MRSENQYLHFGEVDLATDEHFIQWVKKNDQAAATYWENFLRKHPEKEATVLRAKRLLLSVGFEEAEWSEADMSLLKEKIMSAVLQETPAKPRAVRRYLSTFAKVAAVAAAVVAGIYLWKYYRPEDSPLISYITQDGEVKTLYLPDSSKVIMNAQSTLSYKYNGDKQTREVELSGEAYFSVRKDPRQPFRVKLGTLTVQVLGTAFNARSGQDSSTVALESGKVRLFRNNGHSAQEEELMDMLPGQVVAYSERSGNMIQSVQGVEQYTAWKDDILYFDQSPLSEVAAHIKKRYGATLVFPDDIQKQTFSADIMIHGNDISILVRLLEESFQLTSGKKNDTITFTRK